MTQPQSQPASAINPIAVLQFVRETKGAVLYENVSSAPGETFTTLYLRKSGLGNVYPTRIRVTLAVEEV